MDLLERRKAFSAALSAHDVHTIKTFLHPLFVVRGTDGVVVIKHDDFLVQLPTFFHNHPEFKESVDVESQQEKGDFTVLQTRREETLQTLWRRHKVSSHWTEKWKRVNDHWLLAEESPFCP